MLGDSSEDRRGQRRCKWVPNWITTSSVSRVSPTIDHESRPSRRGGVDGSQAETAGWEANSGSSRSSMRWNRRMRAPKAGCLATPSRRSGIRVLEIIGGKDESGCGRVLERTDRFATGERSEGSFGDLAYDSLTWVEYCKIEVQMQSSNLHFYSAFYFAISLQLATWRSLLPTDSACCKASSG